MPPVRTDDFTYAGAFDRSFEEYSEAMRHAPMALNAPLLYQNHPEVAGDMTPDLEADGPFYGTIGAFHAQTAVNQPLGTWYPDYQGNTPTRLQPKLVDVEPWLIPDGG